MKLYFTLTRRAAAALFAAFLLIILTLGDICSGVGLPRNADTHQKRMDFLSSIGVTADENSGTVKAFIIPDSFSDVYANYNKLQKESGYDLEPYKGCEVVQYTYETESPENALVHLLVYNGRIIGGDIAEVSLGGRMKPL